MNYTFYKNFVYIIPVYLYGFSSAYSGELFYEQILYQLYTIALTSLPIFWWSVFDFEFDQKVLRSDPRHYKIGLE